MTFDQERLEKLKQEHFKDIIGINAHSSSELMMQRPQHQLGVRNNNYGHNQTQSDARLPPRPQQIEKVYGNLGDIVSYEEKVLEQKAQKQHSPNSSKLTIKKGLRNDKHNSRRMTGLESIYLQKFDKHSHQQINLMRMQGGKPKFRQTMIQYIDDPEQLVEDGDEFSRQNEMSLMVAENLDKIQR